MSFSIFGFPSAGRRPWKRGFQGQRRRRGRGGVRRRGEAVLGFGCGAAETSHRLLLRTNVSLFLGF